METGKGYFLENLPRLFDYPYHLGGLGWMPQHYHVHDNAVVDGCFICLACNYEETSKLLINGMPVVNEPGQPPQFSVLSNGDRIHTINESPHDEIFFRYSAERNDVIQNFLKPAMQGRTHFFFQGFPQEILTEIRQELSDIEQPGAADRLDQLAIKLVTEIVSSHQCAQQADNSHSMKLHSIAAKLYRGFEFSALLKQYGYSERTFYREWNKIFSESPKEYVQRMRLKHACSLLAGSKRSVGDIADECGFGSITYFHRVFLEKLHMTPLTFRKEQATQLFASVEIPL